MFGKGITLFKLFGFRVRIDLSWLIILVLVVWSLAGGVFPSRYGGFTWQVYLAMGVAAAFGLFASIIFHELCHSLVARRYGMPMKGITLFLFGGVAEMGDEPPSAKAEFMMAIAGPLASVVVAATFLALSWGATAWGWPWFVVGVLRWIGIINVILVGFNLIPGFPLDGGRVLRAVLWHFKRDLRKATQIASRVGAAFGMVLIAFGFLNLLVLNPLGGLWWILIGMFVRGAAKQGYQHVLIRQALHGEPVRRFMSGQPITVAPDLAVDRLVEDYVYQHHHKMFPVTDDGHLAGCVTTREIRQVPREEWAHRTVREIAAPCSSDNTIAADEDAMQALSRMNRNRTSRMLVVEGQRLVGVLSLKDLLEFLSLKIELESEGPAPASRAPRPTRSP